MTVYDQIDVLGKELFEAAEAKGFTGERPLATELMLICSEAFELFEDDRKGKLTSEHIPEFSIYEEEFADIMIRVMETAHRRGLRLGAAIEAKKAFNASRPHKHGKKF